MVQIIGPVIDVEFPADNLPEIYNALRIDTEGDNEIHLTAEVQQHLGRNQVRAVAMSSTDGLVRGTEVTVPRGNDVFEAGDTAIVFALSDAIADVTAMFPS